MDLFTYGFMQRALIAAVVTGLAAPAVGTYLVQRRLALMGDGIGHVAVTGVALGLLTGTSPTWTAVVVAILGAALIELIRERGHANGDVALALLFYGGLAGGVLLTGIGGESAARLQQYLFGSITTISVSDVLATMALAAVVIVGVRRALTAAVRGRPGPGVRPGRRAAGPRVQPAGRGARRGQRDGGDADRRAAAGLGADGGAGRDRPAGDPVVPHHAGRGDGPRHPGLARRAGDRGVRVVPRPRRARTDDRAAVAGGLRGHLAAGGLAAVAGTGCGRRSRACRSRRSSTNRPPRHEHEHGPDCGHVAVRHGDHVDYVHDGHRHAVHGEHYDEH